MLPGHIGGILTLIFVESLLTERFTVGWCCLLLGGCLLSSSLAGYSGILLRCGCILLHSRLLRCSRIGLFGLFLFGLRCLFLGGGILLLGLLPFGSTAHRNLSRGTEGDACQEGQQQKSPMIQLEFHNLIGFTGFCRPENRRIDLVYYNFDGGKRTFDTIGAYSHHAGNEELLAALQTTDGIDLTFGECRRVAVLGDIVAHRVEYIHTE